MLMFTAPWKVFPLIIPITADRGEAALRGGVRGGVALAGVALRIMVAARTTEAEGEATSAATEGDREAIGACAAAELGGTAVEDAALKEA